MGWKIDWTEPALDDLASIVRYIAKDDSDTAISVGDRIVDHVEILQSSRKSARFIGEENPATSATSFPRLSKFIIASKKNARS